MAGNRGGMEIGNPSSAGGAPPPFLSKTYDMVDDPASDDVVSWGPALNSFVVWNPPLFARDLLPKYFKHSNFSSFVRQLNTYGFRKVDPDRWEFANEGFLKNQKHLLKTINRRKTLQGNPNTQLQTAQPHNPVEVGQFGRGEEIERLKRDKNVLMQELIKLRQQQQNTDNQMQTLGKRLQGMEQRQQQMMSFLAKAMRSPSFVSQFVQQNDSSTRRVVSQFMQQGDVSTRRVANANKKRRLPRQGATDADTPDADTPDGQMVKYQPFFNDTMLKMMKMQPHPQAEAFDSSDNMLTENISCSSEAYGSTSSPNSCVTVADVPPSSGAPFMPASSGFSAIHAVSAESKNQSIVDSSVMTMIGTDELPDIGTISDYPEVLDPCLPGIDIAGFQGLQEEAPGGDGIDIPIEEYLMFDPANLNVDPNISCGEDVPFEMDNLNNETEMNFYGSEGKLSFPLELWESMLMHGPIPGDVKEVNASTQNLEGTRQEPLSGWTSARNLEHLTAQMGLLSSNPQG